MATAETIAVDDDEKPRRRRQRSSRRALAGQRLTPIKVFHEDLVELGIVRSRTHQFDMIRSGRLRQPYKDGSHPQSRAWWFLSDIIADMEREKAALEAKAK